MFPKPNPKNQARPAARHQTTRRRGMVVVWLALCMTVFLGIAALSVDQGFHLTRRAQAQKAADSGALAAAYQLSQNLTTAQAQTKAVEYARLNGYDQDHTVVSARATVVAEYPLSGNFVNAQGTSTPYPSNWIRVRVSRPEPRFFGSAFLKLIANVNSNTQLVGAKSIAEFTAFVLMDPNGGGTYGLNDGPATLAVFGPDARYANGDNRSVKTLGDNGVAGAINPDYVADSLYDKDEQSGYNFSIDLPAGFRNSKVDLFDPDCFNKDNVADASAGVRVDEWRAKWSVGAGGIADATNTRYRLYHDNGTPGNLSDDVLIEEKNYNGSDDETDMKWVDAFKFNRRDYAGKNFRLNVMTTSGSSENGFNIRAGRLNDDDGVPNTGDEQYYDDDDDDENQFASNGSKVSAQGYMPMNFNRNGNATVTLGSVPATAANKELVITKFDTDVGAQTVIYRCSSLPGQDFTGVLSGNGEFKTDRIPLPSNYTTGTWTATYTASLQDTSVWSMLWTGGSSGPGRIKLVD